MKINVWLDSWTFQKEFREKVILEEMNNDDNYFECPPEQLDELIQKLQDIRKTITTA